MNFCECVKHGVSILGANLQDLWNKGLTKRVKISSITVKLDYFTVIAKLYVLSSLAFSSDVTMMWGYCIDPTFVTWLETLAVDTNLYQWISSPCIQMCYLHCDRFDGVHVLIDSDLSTDFERVSYSILKSL